MLCAQFVSFIYSTYGEGTLNSDNLMIGMENSQRGIHLF